MITLYIDQELVFEEYKEKSDELISILRNSNSKYKDTDIEKFSWFYSFSFFRTKTDNDSEYYDKLYQMEFDDRYEAELKKVRVSLTLSAGHFTVSDRVNTVSSTIEEIVKTITAQKMVNESEFMDNDILKSIPFVIDSEKIKPLSLEEQLKRAIEQEDYLECARIRDEIKKDV